MRKEPIAQPGVSHAHALELLAGELAGEEGEILLRWRAQVTTEGKPGAVRILTRGDFYDHIPDFLDYLRRLLIGDRVTMAVPARQHGAHRWQQGLDFEEVVHEWSLLRRLLMEWIADHSQALGLEWEAIKRAYRLLAGAIDEGIAVSLNEYEGRQRIEATARMRDLEAALEAGTELTEQRGRTLRDASHDLRGSLQAVQLVSDLLKDRPLDSKSRELLELLGSAVDALGQMFNDLLDLARLEAGHETRTIGDFDAAELLGSLCAELEPLGQAEALALVANGPASLAVRGDAGHVRRIAQNLVLNALKYTPSGRIEVAWRAESPGRWSFQVRDTGDGLPESTAGAFAESLKGASEGLAAPEKDNGDERGKAKAPPAASVAVGEHGEGIGLSIVHHLCNLLDGVLEVDSAPGRGTQFRVLLPSDYPESEKST